MIVKPLTVTTWPDFARLVEENKGVWGGCWCVGFHAEGVIRGANERREIKHALVKEGKTHAALVYDGPACVGWCQFGPTDELPRIKHRRQYEAEADSAIRPDWRITCFFTGRGHRKDGVSRAALAGAIDEIARLGGGRVESYPEDVDGRSVSASFLHNGTVSMFESQGFERARRLGKNHWVVTRTIKCTGELSSHRRPAQT